MAILDEVLQTLEIQPTGIPTVVRLSQNENGRQIRLTMRGNESNFPAGCLVTIAGTKPDGVVYSATGELDGNVAVINEDTQMTAVAGMWKARVQVTYGGSTIATELIVFEVYADPVDPESVPSESELNGLVAEAQYWAENARSSAYGSPLVTDTAAGMIETDRVYVYTGSETDYTAGHWYYYNGSAWTDGGIYNAAAVQTDTTLSVPGMAADAKATGDAIAAEATRTDTLLEGKADIDGNYTDLTAGTALAVLSDSYTVDAVPYKFRQTPYKSRRLMEEIVGGTVAWNQLINHESPTIINNNYVMYSATTHNFTIVYPSGDAVSSGVLAFRNLPLVNGHKYFFCAKVSQSTSNLAIRANLPFRSSSLNITQDTLSNSAFTTGLLFQWETGMYDEVSLSKQSSITVEQSVTIGFEMHDLTQMFNSTIADYIYTLEQTTAGAGVSLFRSLFPADYYAYNTGEIKSVSGLSAHKMRDADDNIIGNYPLDSTLTLRGIPKLVDNKIKFDGDIYASDGTVTRRYGIVDLGTLTWIRNTENVFYATIPTLAKAGGMIAAGYMYDGTFTSSTALATFADKTIHQWDGLTNYQRIFVKDTAYDDATAFTTALSGAYLVYELATATTETADPYINPQICDPDGTEEYVSTTVVPVGHETKYYRDLDAVIPAAPTADGVYTLKCTVTDGVPSYSWEV